MIITRTDVVLQICCVGSVPTSKYVLVSVGTIANDTWLNTHNLNFRLHQFRVFVKVVVLWNAGTWDSVVVETPKSFNIRVVFMKRSYLPVHPDV